MKFNDAVSLIKAPVFDSDQPANWADLGCGAGLFTLALASLLPAGSTIFAVDTSPGIKTQKTERGIRIIARQNDFVKDVLELPPLTGVLMANALHFVENKTNFYRKLWPMLIPGGTLILVEYDTDLPNRWVPYPLSYASIQNRFTKIHAIPSVYQVVDIYGCYTKTTMGEPG